MDRPTELLRPCAAGLPHEQSFSVGLRLRFWGFSVVVVFCECPPADEAEVHHPIGMGIAAPPNSSSNEHVGIPTPCKGSPKDWPPRSGPDHPARPPPRLSGTHGCSLSCLHLSLSFHLALDACRFSTLKELSPRKRRSPIASRTFAPERETSRRRRSPGATRRRSPSSPSSRSSTSSSTSR